MKRREFIGLVGSAPAWPLAARAQQGAKPVVGLLSALSTKDRFRLLEAFQKGLSEAGYVEGRNVAIEYGFAEAHFDRLPALAVDLVRRQVSVLAVLSGTPAALAAKAATSTVPIVFAVGSDPVASGLVSSLNRPEGNVTGVTFFNSPLSAKRLEMIRQLAPKATSIAVLVNHDNPPSLSEGKATATVAPEFGMHAILLHANSAEQIDAAFVVIEQQRIGALYVSADALFFDQRRELATNAARYSVLATYGDREFAEAGGLMSYGSSRPDAYRQAGVYVGRILSGEKIANLPVVLPTKFEMVLNLKVAKALGITVPPNLLALADEVIE
jgi:putative tryptophan/tyrosine transport system substrate-binding protein